MVRYPVRVFGSVAALTAIACTPALSLNDMETKTKMSRVAGAAKAQYRCDVEFDEDAARRYLSDVKLGFFGSDADKVVRIIELTVFSGAGNRDKNPAYCANAMKLYGPSGQWAAGLLKGSGAPKPD